jgi:hypothetical protein
MAQTRNANALISSHVPESRGTWIHFPFHDLKTAMMRTTQKIFLDLADDDDKIPDSPWPRRRAEHNEMLRNLQLKLNPMPLDGNCFFHACKSLNNCVETHDQIRQRFVDELVSGLMEEHDAGGGM